MFTGIVDHCGVITSIVNTNKSTTLTIMTEFADLKLGESIAVDGICLTVDSINQNSFTCQLSPETKMVTSAFQFTKGYKVNLERALQLSDRLGGHFVSGHVDQTARVEKITKYASSLEVKITGMGLVNMPLMIKKGSITINGVSLTINALLDDGLTVMLIPHTLEITNLGGLVVGDMVNIELDMLVKIMARHFELLELVANTEMMIAAPDDDDDGEGEGESQCQLH